MSEINIDLLRKDECEPLTTEQMNDIKSQFHPSNTANVNMVPYHKYSTTEQRVGEWIDGKPLYEKCFQITIPNTSGDGLVVVNTGLSVSTLIELAVALNKNAGGDFNVSRSIYLHDDGSIKIDSPPAWMRGLGGVLLMRYTKTTD